MSEGIPEGQGEGTQEQIDGSQTEDQSTADSGNQSQQESSVNPNWNEALELLPDEFLKNKLIPVFTKWDNNNNSRFEKVQQDYSRFDPYKPLVENNVPIEEIQLAWQLRNEISNNPQTVFERLAQHLGVDVAGLLNGEQGQGLEEENPEGTVNDPRIAEIQRVQELQNAYLAQQMQREEAIQQQQWETQTYNETKAELDKLTETYGNFDRNRVVQEALWVSERTGQPVNLEAGVKSLRSFEDDVRKNSANNSAPNVFSGTGGLASGIIDTSKMTEDEVIALSVARMKAKNGG
jgi:hypothetical protein